MRFGGEGMTRTLPALLALSGTMGMRLHICLVFREPVTATDGFGDVDMRNTSGIGACLNVREYHVSARFALFCCLFGNILPKSEISISHFLTP